MKNRPVITGIIAVVSPVPLFVLSILWSWICFFGIGMGLLNYDPVPLWMLILSLLPLLISPTLGLLGIIHGIAKIKTNKAWLGVLLSVISLIENLLIFGVMMYLSQF